MSALIRNYLPTDQAVVDQLVRFAWSEVATRLQGLTAKAEAREVIVAELDDQLVGQWGMSGQVRVYVLAASFSLAHGLGAVISCMRP
jgi:hypothetical protein